MDNNNIIHLVYFNCRSVAQYLRHVIYEIGAQLNEIHVGNDGEIPEYLQHFDICVTDLPCVIYQGRVFKEMYPTIRFLCQHFNRTDLLGNNLYEQVPNFIIRPKLVRFIAKPPRKKDMLVRSSWSIPRKWLQIPKISAISKSRCSRNSLKWMLIS